MYATYIDFHIYVRLDGNSPVYLAKVPTYVRLANS